MILTFAFLIRSPHKQEVDNGHLGTAGPPKPNLLHHQVHVARPAPSAVGHSLYGDAQNLNADMSAEQPIDPELTRRDLAADPGYAEALKAWGRFRFVRAGWFTAQEAIDYVE